MSVPPGLIVSGVKTGVTGAWKLWVSIEHQRERGRILQGALAIAICNERRDAEDVKELAKDLEAALRKTGVPTYGKRSIGKRLKSGANRLAGRKVRETPEMRVFGPTFSSHLAAWLNLSADSPEFNQRLDHVACGETRTIRALADRFPEAFEEELFDELKATEFREQLIYEMLLTDLVRDERARRVRLLQARRGAARVGAGVAAPAGIAYAAANALGVGEPIAALIGVGVAVLSGAIGGIALERDSVLAAEKKTAAQAVLSWMAHLLGRITSKRTIPDVRALEIALYELLRAEVEGSLHLPSELLMEAGNEAANLCRTFDAQGEGVLARELNDLAESLRDASSDSDLERRALASMFAVVVACDLPQRP